MTLLPLPALPPEVVRALPDSTPPAPWACRVEAVVRWHRAAPSARHALPAETRAGLPLTVEALRARPAGLAVPVAGRCTARDGRRSGGSSVRGRARLARVQVGGEGLPPWLLPGRHPGPVLTGAQLHVGAPA